MAIRYHHTQRGTQILATMAVAAILSASIAFMNPSSPARWLLLVGFAVGFVELAWLFSSLTVAVNEHHVLWYFGPGLWRYRIELANIKTTQAVRNSFWDGFGIRMRPGFRLYNVSGLDAVELRLKTGDIRRIGSDDAPGLASALKA